MKARWGLALILAALLLLSWALTRPDPPRWEPLTLSTPQGACRVTITATQLSFRMTGASTESLYPLPAGETVIAARTARRTPEEQPQVLLIIGPAGSAKGHRFEIVALSTSGQPERRVAESMQGMNPWRLDTADVDGNGVQEISITMYKKAKFHPVMANRPYLYTWKPDRIVPLWRGSRLSRPFAAYIFHDLDGDRKDELLAAETAADGKSLIQAYRWNGFGFEGIAASNPYDQLQQLEVIDGAPVAAVGTEARLHRITLSGEQLTLAPATDKTASPTKP